MVSKHFVYGVAALLRIEFFACQEEIPEKRQHLQASDAVPQETDGILQETLVYIQQKGGSTTRIQCLPDGYVVEGDLVSTEENLTETSPAQLLYVGYEEQYCSTYRVTGLPRTIPMGVASTLPSS